MCVRWRLILQSPNSSPSAASPISAPPPPQASSPPPQPPSPPPQSPPDTNATSPESPNMNTNFPPPPILGSPPPTLGASPPTSDGNSPPLAPSSPSPPTTSPPQSSSPIPPPATSRPPSFSPPPITFSPPPPPKPSSTTPPPLTTSPSPPLEDPPANSPSPPLQISPPPSTPNPPSSPPPLENSPPPPKLKPPANPQPPSPKLPKSPPPSPPSLPDPSPPPAPPAPPEESPPPPLLEPPKGPPTIPSPTPPKRSPPSSSGNSPPSPWFPPPSKLTPPPLSPPGSYSFPPPPSKALVPPPGDTTTNSSSGNAPELSSSSGNGGLSTGSVVAIGLVLGIALLSAIGIATFFVTRRKRRNSRPDGGYILPTSIQSTPQSGSCLLKSEASTSNIVSSNGGKDLNSAPKRGVLGNSRTWFTYKELVNATDGFSMRNLLGEGGFGSVYKGCLADGQEIAVKQLKIDGGQGEREFKAEVEIISRIHHRHLVSLVGYCIWESQRLLVYEYVPNNTLHFHLHGEGRPVLEWARRVKIAAGAARGIAYLHEDCHPRIIHRDIKSSNILLDNNFEARVSDFGLAKLALDTNTHVTTRVVGTLGYMAPEYASSGKLTEKSDVYAFGVVLLELITGRWPVDPSQSVSLVEWARPLLNHALDTEDFESFADPGLRKNYVGREMLQMVEVAAACVRHSAAKRPRMGQVVRAFENLVALDITNGVPVGDSGIYNMSPQFSEIQWLRRMAFDNRDFSSDFFNQGSSSNRSRSSADIL